MTGVLVRDHQNLVLLKPELLKNAVGDSNDGAAVDLVPRRPCEAEVVDRSVDPGRLRGGGAHHQCGVTGMLRWQVSTFAPRDPIANLAARTRFQVPGQAPEPATASGLRDHPRRRMAASTS